MGSGNKREAIGWKTINFYVGNQTTLGKRGRMHSQVGQDWLVATLLGCKRHGFFVDLAANDAVSLSNSLMLERDFEWNGICIEANVEYIYGHAQRKCKLVSGAGLTNQYGSAIQYEKSSG